MIITHFFFRFRFKRGGAKVQTIYLPHDFHQAKTLSRSNPTPESYLALWLCLYLFVDFFKKRKQPASASQIFSFFQVS